MNLLTTTCPCNEHTFTGGDVKLPLMDMEAALGRQEHNFYGGNVNAFSRVKCPKCKKGFILYLKSISGGYSVTDIQPVK